MGRQVVSVATGVAAGTTIDVAIRLAIGVAVRVTIGVAICKPIRQRMMSIAAIAN